MPAMPLVDLMAYCEAVWRVTRHDLQHATDADLVWEYRHPREGPSRAPGSSGTCASKRANMWDRWRCCGA